MKKTLVAVALGAAVFLAACTPPPNPDGAPTLNECYDIIIGGAPDMEYIGPKNTANNLHAWLSEDGSCSGANPAPPLDFGTVVTVEEGEGATEATALCDSLLGAGNHQGGVAMDPVYNPNPGPRNFVCFPNGV